MDKEYIPARDKGDYTSCYECIFQKLLPGIVWGCAQYGKLNISESTIHDGGETYAVIKSIWIFLFQQENPAPILHIM